MYILACKKCFVLYCENKQTKTVVRAGRDTTYAILLYVQQDETLHSLFYLETALHVSGGTITHHQERKQL